MLGKFDCSEQTCGSLELVRVVICGTPCRKSELLKMISLLVRTGLALFVFNFLLSPATALWNNGYGNQERGWSEGRLGDISYSKTLAGTTSGLPAQQATRRGLGISAWGIVIVIVALILAGMGIYYFTICYDICRPSKNKYDKMATPTMA